MREGKKSSVHCNLDGTGVTDERRTKTMNGIGKHLSKRHHLLRHSFTSRQTRAEGMNKLDRINGLFMQGELKRKVIL